jgi:hypothetical protein
MIRKHSWFPAKTTKGDTMANYITNSGFSDLNGSMVATNDNVDSYYSNSLQESGTVRNTGGSGLDFSVSFSATPPRVYHINASANANGNGFTGSANNNGPAAAQDTWEATASTGETGDTAATQKAC